MSLGMHTGNNKEVSQCNENATKAGQNTSTKTVRSNLPIKIFSANKELIRKAFPEN